MGGEERLAVVVDTVDTDETAQPCVGFGGAAGMFVHYRCKKA